MKKNRLGMFLSLLSIVGSALACGSAGGESAGRGSAVNGGRQASANVISDSSKPAADCPQRTLAVSEAKNNGLQKYEGCAVSVRGKIWDLQSTTVELFDSAERTNYNGSIFVGGNFSGNTYSQVGMKLLKLRTEQKYDQLPTATVTGSVKTVGGSSILGDGVLSDFQK